jgi:hypothetical protein
MSNKNSFSFEGGFGSQRLSSLEAWSITPDEYMQSHKGLQEFLAVNLATIQTLEGLAPYAYRVGRDLQTIIVAIGEARVQEDTTRYRIREPIEGSNNKIAAVTSHSGVILMGYRIQDSQQLVNFEVAITGDLGVSEETFVGGFHIKANDYRIGEMHLPNAYPSNASVQQGFARVLRSGVRDILSVIPPPTQIPDTLNS